MARSIGIRTVPARGFTQPGCSSSFFSSARSACMSRSGLACRRGAGGSTRWRASGSGDSGRSWRCSILPTPTNSHHMAAQAATVSTTSPTAVRTTPRTLMSRSKAASSGR